MKKVIVMAAVAAAVLSSCSNDEAVLDLSSNEVQFKAMSISTKALINPYNTDDSTFPITESFGVYAKWSGAEDGAAPFMNYKKVSNLDGDWKVESDEPYLWPANGTIKFQAYYPYGNAVVNEEGFLEFNGINLGNTIGNQQDPMVAITSDIDTDPAKRPSTVGLVFKHTTSQIMITATDVTETVSLQGNITLKEVKVNGVKVSGSYIDGTTSGKGIWTTGETSTSFIVYKGQNKLSTDVNYLSGSSFSTSNNGCAAFVVIPEDLVNGVQTITVTYDVAEFRCNGSIYAAQSGKSATINLYGKNSNNVFACGKRYVYNLGFSLDGQNKEIIFNPTVSGWEEENVNGLIVDCAKDAVVKD